MLGSSMKNLDSGFRRNDGRRTFVDFCEAVKQGVFQ